MKFNDKPQTSWLSTTTSTIHCQLAASIALFSLRLSVWLPVSQSVSLTVFFALLSFHSRLHQLSSTPQPSPVLPSHAYHSLPTLPLSFSLSSVCFFSLSFSAFISYHCVCLFTPGSSFVVSGKRNVAAHCECDKTSNCGSTLAQLAASFVGRSIVPTL